MTFDTVCFGGVDDKFGGALKSFSRFAFYPFSQLSLLKIELRVTPVDWRLSRVAIGEEEEIFEMEIESSLSGSELDFPIKRTCNH